MSRFLIHIALSAILLAAAPAPCAAAAEEPGPCPMAGCDTGPSHGSVAPAFCCCEQLPAPADSGPGAAALAVQALLVQGAAVPAGPAGISLSACAGTDLEASHSASGVPLYVLHASLLI